MAGTLREKLDSSLPVRFFRKLGSTGPSVLAAAIAFNLFFALVPALASVVVAASVFGRSEQVLQDTMSNLNRVLPAETATFVGQVLEDVAKSVDQTQGVVIVVSGLVALWLASRGIHTIQEVLARIASLDERRPWIVAKLVSVLLTAGIAITLVVSSLLVVGGAAVAEGLEDLVDADWPIRVWNLASLPLAAGSFLLFLAALYRWGPPRRFPGMWIASGLSTIGIVGASLGFRFYIDRAGQSGATTLAIFGVVAIVLLWLYLIAYVIIVSGVIAAGVAKRIENRTEVVTLIGGPDV